MELIKHLFKTYPFGLYNNHALSFPISSITKSEEIAKQWGEIINFPEQRGNVAFCEMGEIKKIKRMTKKGHHKFWRMKR